MKIKVTLRLYSKTKTKEVDDNSSLHKYLRELGIPEKEALTWCMLVNEIQEIRHTLISKSKDGGFELTIEVDRIN